MYDEFASKLAAKVGKFKVGYGFDEGVTHGPLIHQAAVDKVQRHVEDAQKKGANVIAGSQPSFRTAFTSRLMILTGGKKMDGLYFEPTVLTNVSADVQISNEETFGTDLRFLYLRVG